MLITIDLVEAASANDMEQAVRQALEGYRAEQEYVAQKEAALKAWEEELTKPDKFAREPGNREREAVFRAVIQTEKALADLPDAHAQVAGWLQAMTWTGGRTGNNNALSKYVTAQVRLSFETGETALLPEVDGIEVYVDSLGTIVESPRYQMCIDPMPWQQMFIERLYAGDFPKLLARPEDLLGRDKR